MIKLYLQGIDDRENEVDLTVPVEEIEEIYPEFIGTVHISGKLRKLGKRYTMTGKVECQASLECDISLKTFIENIEADLSVSFLADSYLYNLLKEKGEDNYSEHDEIIIPEEGKYIDLTSIVREVLVVNLPMKRVAPEYRGKDFETLYPEYTSIKQGKKKKKKVEEIDERWAPLKNLKLDN
jgi:uncharacterized metal-binding protein YceD (DUF177 family)